MPLREVGWLDSEIAEGRLPQHDIRASGSRHDLLRAHVERQPDDLAWIRFRDVSDRQWRMRLARERLKINALLVGEDLAGQIELDHRDPNARPRMAVDPYRAAVERKTGRRFRRGLEAHFVGVVAVDISLADELIVVFVGEVDIERKLRDLFRLNQRKLGNAAVLPFHAVDEEV